MINMKKESIKDIKKIRTKLKNLDYEIHKILGLSYMILEREKKKQEDVK